MLFLDGAMGRSAKYSSSFHSDLGVLAPRAVRASSLRNSVGASRPRCFGHLLAFFVSDAHLLSFLLSNFCHLSKKMEKSLRRLPLSRVTKTIVASWQCHAESFCASGKSLRVTLEITLGSFQMVWKVSGWSGKFPDSLESFRIIWKVSE